MAFNRRLSLQSTSDAVTIVSPASYFADNPQDLAKPRVSIFLMHQHYSPGLSVKEETDFNKSNKIGNEGTNFSFVHRYNKANNDFLINFVVLGHDHVSRVDTRLYEIKEIQGREEPVCENSFHFADDGAQTEENNKAAVDEIDFKGEYDTNDLLNALDFDDLFRENFVDELVSSLNEIDASKSKKAEAINQCNSSENDYKKMQKKKETTTVTSNEPKLFERTLADTQLLQLGTSHHGMARLGKSLGSIAPRVSEAIQTFAGKEVGEGQSTYSCLLKQAQKDASHIKVVDNRITINLNAVSRREESNARRLKSGEVHSTSGKLTTSSFMNAFKEPASLMILDITSGCGGGVATADVKRYQYRLLSPSISALIMLEEFTEVDLEMATSIVEDDNSSSKVKNEKKGIKDSSDNLLSESSRKLEAERRSNGARNQLETMEERDYFSCDSREKSIIKKDTLVLKEMIEDKAVSLVHRVMKERIGTLLFSSFYTVLYAFFMCEDIFDDNMEEYNSAKIRSRLIQVIKGGSTIFMPISFDTIIYPTGSPSTEILYFGKLLTLTADFYKIFFQNTCIINNVHTPKIPISDFIKDIVETNFIYVPVFRSCGISPASMDFALHFGKFSGYCYGSYNTYSEYFESLPLSTSKPLGFDFSATLQDFCAGAETPKLIHHLMKGFIESCFLDNDIIIDDENLTMKARQDSLCPSLGSIAHTIINQLEKANKKSVEYDDKTTKTYFHRHQINDAILRSAIKYVNDLYNSNANNNNEKNERKILSKTAKLTNNKAINKKEMGTVVLPKERFSAILCFAPTTLQLYHRLNAALNHLQQDLDYAQVGVDIKILKPYENALNNSNSIYPEKRIMQENLISRVLAEEKNLFSNENYESDNEESTYSSIANQAMAINQETDSERIIRRLNYFASKNANEILKSLNKANLQKKQVGSNNEEDTDDIDYGKNNNKSKDYLRQALLSDNNSTGLVNVSPECTSNACMSVVIQAISEQLKNISDSSMSMQLEEKKGQGLWDIASAATQEKSTGRAASTTSKKMQNIFKSVVEAHSESVKVKLEQILNGVEKEFVNNELPSKVNKNYSENAGDPSLPSFSSLETGKLTSALQIALLNEIVSNTENIYEDAKEILKQKLGSVEQPMKKTRGRKQL